MTKEHHLANTLYCSFCGKSQHEVVKLIAGPTVFICDECIILCVQIVAKDPGSMKRESAAQRTLREDALVAITKWLGEPEEG